MELELGEYDDTDYFFVPTNHPGISKLTFIGDRLRIFYQCHQQPQELFKKLKTLPSLQSLHFHFDESWDGENDDRTFFYDGLIELLEQQRAAGSPITQLGLRYRSPDKRQEIRFFKYLFQTQPLVDHVDYSLSGIRGLPFEFVPVITCKVNKLELNGCIMDDMFNRYREYYDDDDDDEQDMVPRFQSFNNVDKITVLCHQSYDFISGLLRYNTQSLSIVIKHLRPVPVTNGDVDGLQMVIDAIQDNPLLHNVQIGLSRHHDYTSLLAALQQHPNHATLLTVNT
ncbi:hypothetical protein SAMD00019534_028330 [Acytostelium subglobosum LB1]|uniref:hypothetical protein n=1 Tax=Acytostelium subglobosum LB1 TaxID=1410327 RepID=UPI000644FB1C|nr:hypothetical protein SAMD00019534_028330 [Acytostelium subglobosum LB1]GAM19658.1 hypothetical protein SAMD00019534_028330 [Acytostelium subglobosum LB1]|eukprot:XP_012756420.1 hypothetical protein SAMD00019534_028330 [Acytostelium subglobosum LB1]